jgi:hypothetical protein
MSQRTITPSADDLAFHLGDRLRKSREAAGKSANEDLRSAVDDLDWSEPA